jgi:hypothetical protein
MLHSFMQQLYILSDDLLTQIAPTLNDLTKMIYLYVQDVGSSGCKHAVIENIDEICCRYFGQSKYSAVEFLETLRMLGKPMSQAVKYSSSRLSVETGEAIREGKIRIK